MNPMSTFEGPVWRLIPAQDLDHPALPAKAPAGRFHYSGQVAVYASLSAVGAGVAVRRYLGDGVSRLLVPMGLAANRIADVRGTPEASMVWQDIVEGGKPSPTWAYSDAARAAGAEALLYSSRSRPELSHVVVFDPECLRQVGPASAFNGT